MSAMGRNRTYRGTTELRFCLLKLGHLAFKALQPQPQVGLLVIFEGISQRFEAAPSTADTILQLHCRSSFSCMLEPSGIAAENRPLLSPRQLASASRTGFNSPARGPSA